MLVLKIPPPPKKKTTTWETMIHVLLFGPENLDQMNILQWGVRFCTFRRDRHIIAAKIYWLYVGPPPPLLISFTVNDL